MQYRTQAGALARRRGRAVARHVAEALGAGERMLDDLKDTAVQMRTLPVSAITGPLPRAIRDLAQAGASRSSSW